MSARMCGSMKHVTYDLDLDTVSPTRNALATPLSLKLPPRDSWWLKVDRSAWADAVAVQMATRWRRSGLSSAKVNV